MSNNKTLIGVPFHALNKEHVDFFLDQLKKNMGSLKGLEIDWEIDVNGCQEEIITNLNKQIKNLKKAVRSVSAKDININITITKEGGRSDAMNRISSLAIKQNYGSVVFLNDDVILSEEALGHLITASNNNRMISATCLPYDMISDKKSNPSLVQQAEIYRYWKNGVDGKPFRGDLFAVNTETLRAILSENLSFGVNKVFADIHSDDLFLNYWHKETYGNNAKALDNCFAFHFPEKTWFDAAHRITRHFEGTDSLLDQDRWKKYDDITKGIEGHIDTFLASFDKAKHLAEEIGIISNIKVEVNIELQGFSEVWDEYIKSLKKNRPNQYLRLPKSYEVKQVLATLQSGSDDRGIIQEQYKDKTYDLVSKTLRLLSASKSQEKAIVNGSNWNREQTFIKKPQIKINKRKRVAFWVESRHGAGHMNIVAQTVKELEKIGFEVIVLTTTEKMARDFNLRQNQLVVLPGYMSESGPDSDKTTNGLSTLEDKDWHEQRARVMISALKEFKPDAFITEAWPLAKGPVYDYEGEKVVISLREKFKEKIQILGIASDINLYTREPVKFPFGGSEETAVNFIKGYYDRIFVRGDKDFVDLKETFLLADLINDKLQYSGYFIQSEIFKSERQKQDIIIISSGVGFKEVEDPEFFLKVFEAVKISNISAEVICFVNDKLTRFAEYQHIRDEANNNGVQILETSPRYRDFLKEAKLLISRSSYNNTIEANLTNTPNIVIPRLSSKEQMARADIYSRKGIVRSIHPDSDITELASAIEQMYGSKVKPMNVEVDGAKNLAEYINQQVCLRQVAYLHV